MKKILSLTLCIIFVLSLAACGEKSHNKQHDIDIEYYTKLGQIDGVDYKLGDDVKKTKESLSAAYYALDEDDETHTHDHEHEAFYYDLESGDYTVMTDGNVTCCYKTDDKKSGLTHIVKFGDAYGFSLGDISTQLSKTMSELGFEAEERDAQDGEIFFLPSSSGMTVLEYKIGDVNVMFVFTEHALTATAIYK